MASSDDELVEIQVGRSRPPRRGAASRSPFQSEHVYNPPQDANGSIMGNILLAQLDMALSSGSSAMSRGRRRNETRPPPLILPSHGSPDVVQLPQPAAVIDLTEEPDSPTDQAQSQLQTSVQAGRNPRRTNSQRTTPPSLSRSDNISMMGQGPSVIDLTADSPGDERQSEPRMTRSRYHHHHHHHHHHHPRSSGFGPDHLIELEFLDAANSSSLYSNIASNFTRRVRRFTGFLNSDFMARSYGSTGSTEFPSSAGFTVREPSPKPPMEPVPPTREGFTRDTSRAEEIVVVCPACNDELAYDPSGGASQHPSTGGAKKRKRTPGEHHFWALKRCGHVYCAGCFENRRPTKTSPEGVGFRAPPGKAASAAPNEIRCAVDSCDTKVALKTEWVGIFL